MMAALVGFSLLWLTISYDIACQWKIHLAERMPNLPEELSLPLDKIKVQYALPVWHAGSHNEDCQDENSLSFKVGVGKTDGEGVERTWLVLNPAAFLQRVPVVGCARIRWRRKLIITTISRMWGKVRTRSTVRCQHTNIDACRRRAAAQALDRHRRAR
jgi:hypothetical protein